MEKIAHELRKPFVCTAVRAVGTLKPEFNPEVKAFIPPQLKVRGTGFWLKHSEAFITCAHVVADIAQTPIELSGMLVVGGNGADYLKAVISVLDYMHDLAILHVEGSDEFLKEQSNQGFELINTPLRVGEKVAYAGFPFGNLLLNEKHTPTYSEGVIGTDVFAGEGSKFIQISGSIAGGYSGAPIVLKSDPSKVLAVVSNSPMEEVGVAGIFRGIHYSHIEKILDLIKS